MQERASSRYLFKKITGQIPIKEETNNSIQSIYDYENSYLFDIEKANCKK